MTVCFKVRSEHVDDFRKAILENAHTSLCLEFGCLLFDVCEDVTKQEFFLYEVYASPGAFDEHLASAHFKAFDSVSASWITDKKVTQYTRLTCGIAETNHLEV
ncbi:hypothetical protein LMG26411_04721 [Cupriavidus numazuensis]|uniref:ABM domain-containing protein n=1 Tax=Cupriavidus numazuensis TaxID=221992 RepID=A0ABM8TMV0_9BURK|nr:hypothetical protein LMG26411_04721 [Cupriavidus numazuensis]